MSKSFTLTKDVKNQIKHCDKNLLDLEEIQESEEGSEASSDLDFEFSDNPIHIILKNLHKKQKAQKDLKKKEKINHV
jgi:hypothetical protein